MLSALPLLALLAAAEPPPLEGCSAAHWGWKNLWRYDCGDWSMSIQDAFRMNAAKAREAVDAILDDYAEDVEPGPFVRTPRRDVCYPYPRFPEAPVWDCRSLEAEVPSRPKRSKDDPVEVRDVSAMVVTFDRREGTRIVSCVDRRGGRTCKAGIALLVASPWRSGPLPGVAEVPKPEPAPPPPALQACRARSVPGGWQYLCDRHVVGIVDDPHLTAAEARQAIDATLDGFAAGLDREHVLSRPPKRIDHIRLQLGLVEVVRLDVPMWEPRPAWKSASRRKERTWIAFGAALPRPEGFRLLICASESHLGTCGPAFERLSTAPWRGPAVEGSAVEGAAPGGGEALQP